MWKSIDEKRIDKEGFAKRWVGIICLISRIVNLSLTLTSELWCWGRLHRIERDVLLALGLRRDSRNGLAVTGAGRTMCRGRRAHTLIPSRSAVDTHGLATVSLAGLERPGVVIRGHVPHAAHNVVDMLAVCGGVVTNLCSQRIMSLVKFIDEIDARKLTQARMQNSESDMKFVHS